MADLSNGDHQTLSPEDALDFLATGEIDVQGLIPRGSNYTVLVQVKKGELQAFAVYKPSRGENPLWDFPYGTLALREMAAYLVSEALGWDLVPPTVFRDGPEGPGIVQLYIDADPRKHYFTLNEQFRKQFKRIALFDILINNADRKSGHCLCDRDGHIWAIDHGVCFHEDPKLRTVIWEFAGHKIGGGLLRDLRSFRDRLNSETDAITMALRELLDARELAALRQRADRLIARGHFPLPDQHRRHTPWPAV